MQCSKKISTLFGALKAFKKNNIDLKQSNLLTVDSVLNISETYLQIYLFIYLFS